jgi:hypothetical protein
MGGVFSTVATTIPSIPGITGSAGTIPSLPTGSGSFQTGGSGVTVDPSSGFGLASLAGALVEILAVVVVMGLVGVFVIIVVANRADPDPSGRRPQTVYNFAVAFVTITTAIIGSAVVVGAVLQLIGSHSGSITNSVARAALLGGLVTVVSLALLLTHLRRGLALTGADAAAASPSRRVGQSYASAVSFLSILSILVTSVVAVYLIFSLASPGVFGSLGGRTSATRALVEVLYLGLVAVLVLTTHRTLVPPGQPPLDRSAGPGSPGGPHPASLPSIDVTP